MEIITSHIEAWRYLSIFLLMFLESALVPIPSEITMPYGGFLASQSRLELLPVILAGALGNLTGSLVAFRLGKSRGEEWVRSIIRHWGKWFLVKEKDFNRAKKWFYEKGSLVAFWSRLLPVVRTFISLPAGIGGMDIKKFSLYTFLGSLIWSAFLAYLGFVLGHNWQIIEPYFSRFQFTIIALFIIGSTYYVYHHLKED